MAGAPAELKGVVLRGVLRDAKEAPGGIPQLLERMPPADRERYFAARIIHGTWYDYGAFRALLDAYAKAPGHGGATAFHRLGERMAERDFTTLLKVYAFISSVQRLADVPRAIWVQRFRNAGEAASETGDNQFRFIVSGFPGMHPMHCEILTGYGAAVGRQKAGAFKNVHDRCVHRGDRDCSWLSTW